MSTNYRGKRLCVCVLYWAFTQVMQPTKCNRLLKKKKKVGLVFTTVFTVGSIDCQSDFLSTMYLANSLCPSRTCLATVMRDLDICLGNLIRRLHNHAFCTQNQIWGRKGRQPVWNRKIVTTEKHRTREGIQKCEKKGFKSKEEGREAKSSPPREHSRDGLVRL